MLECSLPSTEVVVDGVLAAEWRHFLKALKEWKILSRILFSVSYCIILRANVESGDLLGLLRDK